MKNSLIYYFCSLLIIISILGFFFDSKWYISHIFEGNTINSNIWCPPVYPKYNRDNKLEVKANYFAQLIYDQELKSCEKIKIDNDPVLNWKSIYSTVILFIVIFMTVYHFNIKIRRGPVGAAISFLEMKDTLTHSTEANYSDASSSITTKKLIFLFLISFSWMFIWLYYSSQRTTGDIWTSLFVSLFFIFPLTIFLLIKGILFLYKK